MENSNYKNENIAKKHLNNKQKTPIFKGKKYSFRIRKRFYRIGRYIIKRSRSKN